MNILLTVLAITNFMRYNLIVNNLKGMINIFPVKKNQEYNVTIDAVSSDGNGIAHIDGYTVFVPHTLTGDVARTLIVKVKSSYGYGKLIEIITPSDMRTEPPCRYCSKCGGCQFMHVSYPAQLELKRGFVRDAILRIGGIDSNPGIIGAENPQRYRNKMIFPFDSDKNWGFYRNHSHDVIPLSDCLLGNELNADIMNAVSDYMKKYNIPAYDEAAHRGIIRRVFIRSAQDNFMVIISANSDTLPRADSLITALKSVSDKISGIILNINKKRTNLVLGEKNITLWGSDTLSAVLCGLKYEISPHSFFQINPQQTEKLYNAAIEYADISPNDTVMDIYCGIGTISLTAAKYAEKVIGIEIVPEAIRDAKQNAVANNITNAEFYCSAAEDIVPELLENHIKPDIIILDPPRKGSDEATLGAIVNAEPKRIVYVSCNPATLARDVKFLSQNGYALTKITAVDMFPYTAHVECVVLMTKAQK